MEVLYLRKFCRAGYNKFGIATGPENFGARRFFLPSASAAATFAAATV
jgi:hypothetical protein